MGASQCATWFYYIECHILLKSVDATSLIKLHSIHSQDTAGRPRNRGSISSREKIFLSSSQLWGPQSLLCNVYHKLFRWGVKVTTHFHLLPRLTARRTLSIPSHVFITRRLIMHRGNILPFIFRKPSHFYSFHLVRISSELPNPAEFRDFVHHLPSKSLVNALKLGTTFSFETPSYSHSNIIPLSRVTSCYIHDSRASVVKQPKNQ
jgi:hypothetical protein